VSSLSEEIAWHQKRSARSSSMMTRAMESSIVEVASRTSSKVTPSSASRAQYSTNSCRHCRDRRHRPQAAKILLVQGRFFRTDSIAGRSGPPLGIPKSRDAINVKGLLEQLFQARCGGEE
jgi:hypothetical protein